MSKKLVVRLKNTFLKTTPIKLYSVSYKYILRTKGIFSRDEELTAESKEQIEQYTGIEIPEGVWLDVLKRKKGIAENADHIIIIQKI